MEPLDEQVKEEIEDIIERLNRGEQVEFAPKIEDKKTTFVRYGN